MDAPRSRPDRRRTWPPAAAVRDLRGGVRLLFDGVRGGLDRLDAARTRLGQVDPPVQDAGLGRASARLAPVLLRGLRGTADLLGGGLDFALASVQASLLDPQQGAPAPSPARESLVAFLQAVAGDHLHRTGNPLAVSTALHLRGPVRPRALVLVHDLGLAEPHWQQRGHSHAQALAGALDASPVIARYNSGRHVAAVARELSAELELLLGRWPVALEGALLVGHGLGGLVLRSALLQASRSGLAWPGHVRHLVFLGTPHLGVPDAQRAAWSGLRGAPAALLGPLARLSRRRSNGLSDFGEGRLLDPDPRTGEPAQHPTIGLPAQVACHAVAGAVGEGRSDGLVPLDSALGRHPVASRDLQLADADRWIAAGVDHLGLLGSEAVFQKMRQWLSA